MKKNILVTAALLSTSLFFNVNTVSASGWRIPEQSIDSLAKAGANIASANHADAAYYNPAKMGWLADRWQIEMDLNYIHLTAVDYDDQRANIYDHQSEKENFLVPSGFMASPDFGGVRFGLAVVGPYGLAKHWKNGYGEAFVKKFGLAVYEVNPTISYTVGDMFGFAAGMRVLRAAGSVHSDARIIGKELSRDMNGKTTEFGWNAAVNVHPKEGLDFALTYRSFVSLDFAEESSLNLLGNKLLLDSEISIPAPAVLALSVAYDVCDDVTVELTWDRTFWSEYAEFDFDFSPVIPGNPYEATLVRDWDDSDAFRLGVAYQMNDKVTLLAGLSYDKSPVPAETLDFSVPDANAWLYSIGVRYRFNEHVEAGFSALYDRKEKRSHRFEPTDNVYGTFSNAAALLLTAGINYTF